MTLSAPNTIHPLSNADLYPQPREPESFRLGISKRQHDLIAAIQIACTLGAINTNPREQHATETGDKQWP
jgi:hypothetical protein